MSSGNASCTGDADCPDSLLCYNKVAWAPDRQFCGCSSWYGSVGENCDDFSVQSYFFITSACLLLIVAVFLLIPTLYYGLYVGFIKYKAWDWDASSTTWLFAFISILFIGIYQGLLLSVATDPGKATFIPPGLSEKGATYLLAERIVFIIGVGAAALAGLNISLMWLEVSERIEKLQTTESNVKRYRNIIYGTQAVVALGVFAALVVQNFVIVAVAGIPINCVIILTYVIGRRRFMNLELSVRTAQVSTSRNDVQKATRRVISTSFIIIVFLVFNQIWFIAFAVMSAIGWKNYAPIGALNPVIVTAQLGVGMYLAFAAVINRYTLRSIAIKVGKIKKDTQATPNTFKSRKRKQKGKELPQTYESIIVTL